MLVAVRLAVVAGERVLAGAAERRPLVVAGGGFLLAQDREQVVV